MVVFELYAAKQQAPILDMQRGTADTSDGQSHRKRSELWSSRMIRLSLELGFADAGSGAGSI